MVDKSKTEWIKALGGRKSFVALLALIAGGVTVGFKGDIPINFLTLLQSLVGAYVAGNAAEHLSGALGKKKLDETPQASNPTAGQSQLETKLDQLIQLNMVSGQAIGYVAEVTKHYQDAAAKNGQ